MKARDPRKTVLLRAQVRAGATWTDACIVNVSSRGLGLQAATPPEWRSYVEVRSGSQTVVARVAWATKHRFGLKIQDPLLLSAATGKSESLALPTAKTPSAAGDRERRFGRALEFAGLGLAAAAAALLLADTVGKALLDPMSRVRPVLAQE